MHFIKGSKRVELNECFSDVKSEIETKLVDLISNFVEKSCATDGHRPFPLMLGDGQSINLHKLYDVVKQKGGFDSVSKNGLWDEVGLLYGLGPGLGSSIKLIYMKYLKSLESWLVKLHKDSGNSALSEEALMQLENEYNGFVSMFSDEMRKNDKYFVVKMDRSDNSFVDSSNDDDSGEKIKRKKIDTIFSEIVDLRGEDDRNLKFKRNKIGRSLRNVELTEDNKEDVKLTNCKWGLERVESNMSFMDDNFLTQSDSRRSSVGEDVGVYNVVKSSQNSNASMKCLTEVESKSISVDSSVLKKEVSVHDTRHGSLPRMVQWMTNVAKDPTDPEIGEIPESSEWAKFENHNEWKQVLLGRQAIFVKRDQGSITDIWQKKQRMHPSMYEDQIEVTERLRSSSRHSLLFVNVPKSSSSSPSPSHHVDMDRGHPRQRLDARLDLKPRGSIYTSRPQQRIPVGPYFQAEVPDWTGVPSESDPKWLGTQVWALETGKWSVPTERGPIGKGRVDGCDCASSGSIECVKLHVAERSRILKVELGSVFYVWNFHNMGEGFSVSWTSDEEMKFINVVKENPLSLQKFFWLEMSKTLPRKTWTDLVNYYFNVFVLRRRGSQNRLSRHDVDSDDDETEYRFTARYLGCRSPLSSVSNTSSKKGHSNTK